jgi:hypothetical protein
MSCGGEPNEREWRNATWEEIDSVLGQMEALQSQKVIALARRLRPGLTLEDIRNPHDFPELGDPDWHYEDGVLTGIQSVRTALRSRGRVETAPEGDSDP